MSSFQIDFDINKYKHLWIDAPPSEEIINSNKDIKDAIWERQTSPHPHKEFIQLEHKRLRQGAYIYIKDELLWIPPNYYQYLQYGIVGGVSPQFRLKKLKHKYFKIQVRNNPQAIGTITVKGRQEGETTDVISDAWWELGEGINNHGMIGIQSKTDEDAYNPCWLAVKAQWMNYPIWLKELLYNDIVNPKHMENQVRIEREQSEGKPSRSLYFKYYPSVFNAMDGKTNVLRCIDDEIFKWKNCSLYDTYINQKKFILNGVERRGLFDMFSSPSDTNGRWNEEGLSLYEGSDPNNLNEDGTTSTRLFSYHLSPLEGIQGLYDKYGDADPNKCYEHIMRERKSVPKEKRLAEIRAYALNKEEMFGAHENKAIWSNSDGLIARKSFISRSIYKNEVTREPKWMWGNLEWENGIEFSKVIWRPNKENKECVLTGRICLSEILNYNEELRSYLKPPQFVNGVIGYDPKHKQVTTRKGSNSGICAIKFRDGIVDAYPLRPICISNCEPQFLNTTWDDLIKLMIFLRFPIQYEGSSDEFERYMENKGLSAWLLDKTGSKTQKGEIVKGDAFRNIMTSIDIITNVPVNDGDPYILENWWFEELIDQILNFDEKNHQPSDLFMALVQAVFGMFKILKLKKKTADKAFASILDYWMS